MSLAVITSLSPHRSTALEENGMAATYTFDVFSTLDGYGSYHGGTGAATGVNKAPSFSTTASPCTARSSGWCSGPTPFGNSCSCWARALPRIT
jgi:hypothetical protein